MLWITFRSSSPPFISEAVLDLTIKEEELPRFGLPETGHPGFSSSSGLAQLSFAFRQVIPVIPGYKILKQYFTSKEMVNEWRLGISIGGSVVECSPATRAARVRFPADAVTFLFSAV